MADLVKSLGYAAAKNGGKLLDNPYKGGSEFYRLWRVGFLDYIFVESK